MVHSSNMHTLVVNNMQMSKLLGQLPFDTARY